MGVAEPAVSGWAGDVARTLGAVFGSFESAVDSRCPGVPASCGDDVDAELGKLEGEGALA